MYVKLLLLTAKLKTYIGLLRTVFCGEYLDLRGINIVTSLYGHHREDLHNVLSLSSIISDTSKIKKFDIGGKCCALGRKYFIQDFSHTS
jgi:hypothetical protein